MFAHLALSRPLAVLDLETTGPDPATARAVEVSVLRVEPDGRHAHRTRRLDPGGPIPASATAVHGIADADVAGCPPFRRVAAGLAALLDGCDLCGFNLKRYDLRVLAAEFRRAGVAFDLAGRAVVDVMELYHGLHPRTLTAAVRQYLGREHAGAHGAAADTAAAAAVLDAILAAHAELPRDAAGLATRFAGPTAADAGGFFTRVGGEVRLRVGRHRGQPLTALAAREPDYLRWLARQEVSPDTTRLALDALLQAGVAA